MKVRNGAKVALTKEFIKTIKPSDSRVRFYDIDGFDLAQNPVSNGLVLQVEPTGAKGWKFAYRFEGRPRLFSIGKVSRVTLAAARKEVATLNEQVADRVDPQAAKARILGAGTFKGMLADYYEWARGNIKSWRQYQYQIDRWAVPEFGSRSVLAITQEDVRKLFKKRKEESVSSAMALLHYLSAFFVWAGAEEGGGLKKLVNPCNGVARTRFDKTLKLEPRKRILLDAEIPKFWNEFDKVGLVFSTAFKVILATGQRPGEVCAMRYQDLEIGDHAFNKATVEKDGEVEVIETSYPGGWWKLPGKPEGTWPGTKNGRDHGTWLAPEVVAMLDELHDGERPAEGKVFGCLRPGYLNPALQRICSRLGVTKASMTEEEWDKAKVVSHDLRRTMGSTITSLGFSMELMDRVLNHPPHGVGTTYNWYEYESEIRQIVTAVGKRLRQLIEGKTPGVVNFPSETQKHRKAE